MFKVLTELELVLVMVYNSVVIVYFSFVYQFSVGWFGWRFDWLIGGLFVMIWWFGILKFCCLLFIVVWC